MNKKTIILAVGVIVLAGLAGAYVMIQPKESTPNTASNPNADQTTEDTNNNHDALSPSQPTDGSNNAVNQPSNTTEVVYTNSGFSPRSITVKKGATLKVTNNSSNSLQFSSDDHPTHTKDPELNMAPISPNQSGTLKLEKTGTWGVHNHLMPSDTCTVTVTD